MTQITDPLLREVAIEMASKHKPYELSSFIIELLARKETYSEARRELFKWYEKEKYNRTKKELEHEY